MILGEYDRTFWNEMKTSLWNVYVDHEDASIIH